MSSSQGSSSRHEAPKLPLHLDTQSSRHEPPKLSLHSGPSRQSQKPNRPLQDVSRQEAKMSRKPNRPLQGDPKDHPAAPEVDFTTLQLAIDSNHWKEDQHFFNWIFETYLKLVAENKKPPTGFGSEDFTRQVDAIWEDGEDIHMQDAIDEEIDLAFEQGRRHLRPAPVIAGTEAARNLRLVDYSDSEEDEPSQQQGGAQPPRPPPLPIDQYYTLSRPINSYVKKFRVHGKAYTVHFQNQDQMSDLQKILIEVFRQVLQAAFNEGEPGDLVGVQIRHPALHKGYYNITFKAQSEITAERLFAILEYLMDYDDTFSVDDSMDIIFTWIKDTRGGTRADPHFIHRDFMLKHGGPKGGCFIQVYNPDDNLCLARALVVAKARIDKDSDPEAAKQWSAIRQGEKVRSTTQKRMAQKLMTDAGLGDHQDQCGLEEMKKLQAVLEPEYQIKVFSASCLNFISFQGKIPSEKVLHIYHDIDEEGKNGHFMVLCKPHVLFTKQMWCDKCNKGYNDKKAHKCISKCYSCFGLTECPMVKWKECTDCNRWFRSEECFQKHKTLAKPIRQNKRQKQNWSTCLKIRRCKDCKRLLNYEKMKSFMGVPVHKCGLYFCTTCKQDHKEGTEVCFMQPITEKKKEKDDDSEDDPDSIDNIVRHHERMQDAGVDDAEVADFLANMDDMDKEFLGLLEDLAAENGQEEEDLDGRGTKIFFDLECRQEKMIGENQVGPIFVHEPNLCVVAKVCNLCKDKVKKRIYNQCKSCGVNKKIFWGDSCREDFCKWLFSVNNRGAIAIAHNAKGYDSQFLIQYLIKETLIPQVISKGLSIMMLQYGEVKVLDSLNFLPMGLAQLPKAFGEAELKKGYFPHRFNTKENMDYVGDWPSSWFYDPGNMTKEKRNIFYDWYRLQLGKEFDFQKEILQYCESDVDILMRCCLKFEELFFKVTGVKPFDVAVTIASACMHVFKKNFLKVGSIALIPNGGYRRRENQSLQALRWLKWISEENDINIQHARNGGEKRIGQYKVDGFDRDKTVYEFHGCVWHGCRKCYKQREKKVPQSATTLEDAYQSTLTKIKFIKDKGYEVVEMWECQLKKELRENGRMREFFKKLEEIPEPLDHREALRGGRTNATKLYHKCQPGEYMSYVDVCSLYPWGVKYTRFPVGHPQIITENIQPITAANNPYFGLIKCSILPPKKLLHPVLPYKAGGKLMFPLCKSCAEDQRQDFCKHTDKERALTSTWVSTEVDKNQSLQALRWLKWISEENDINIQHARNGGEKRIGQYKVDGFDRDKTVYEFHGCVWHGCRKCYKQREKKVPQSATTLEDAYQSTLTKIKFIKDKGYEVVEMWECQLKKELRENGRMREFFKKLEEIPEPLDHREALRGGRTNATKLYHKCQPGEYMSYVDVCSLYPWGVKYTRFPVGHPQIITENIQPITAANNPYFGLIKCSILPPKKLLHPVLPYKAGGKLMFPLCKSCAEDQRQDFCKHTDKERALTSTWVSTEVDKALNMGYKILSVAEVWHYKESDQYDGKDENTGLFTRYINCFMKLKIQASGWPSWVKTEADKEKFILECEEREGIKLDPTNIEKNAGLRSLAKICLNSFWGKFGQRSNMSKDVFVFDPAKFSEIVFDDTNVLENIQVLSDEVLYVTYSKQEDYAELMSHTNPVIAAFTTANCRLRLYEELERLGARVFYFDTDSVIYITRPGDVYHPKLGSFLGDMTDELADYGPGSTIVEFVSGGPKNYAFKIKTASGKNITIVKIRGFTLNHHAAAHLNMKNLKKRVFEFVRNGESSKMSIVQPQIGRSITREVVTKDVKKDYGITYDKRWVLADFTTLPYGTCEN